MPIKERTKIVTSNFSRVGPWFRGQYGQPQPINIQIRPDINFVLILILILITHSSSYLILTEFQSSANFSKVPLSLYLYEFENLLLEFVRVRVVNDVEVGMA